MNNMNISIKKLTSSAIIPTYGTLESAGADLYADIGTKTLIPPHKTLKIKTGIAIQIPKGFVGLIYARSGISTKQGLAPANKVGVIDSDYRGEIIVSLHNHSDEVQYVDPCERIAQIVFTQCYQAAWHEVDEFDDITERGDGGFGSTGTM